MKKMCLKCWEKEINMEKLICKDCEKITQLRKEIFLEKQDKYYKIILGYPSYWNKYKFNLSKEYQKKLYKIIKNKVW